MTQEPHPDTIADWKKFKEIARGSKQAIEDEAIDAYLTTWKATGDLKKAEEANRLVYSKYHSNGR